MKPVKTQTLILAPLQGYTEVDFRLAWSSVFSGIDSAVSPFIPLASGSRFRDKHLRDVLPESNRRMKVIPQVLGNDPEKFLTLAQRLEDLGYETVNWNLGCPKRTVARKKRGSGILPYPELLREILEKLVPRLPVRLSVKTRLGYENPEEFYELVLVYNDFPLESLIVHPRTGIQQYEGDMFMEVLDQTIGEIRHRVVFSGDIADRQSFTNFSARFSTISDWMIGRGMLSNPALAEIILGKEEADDPAILRTRQIYFHQELYCEIRAKLQRTKTILNKMKDYWSYFSRWFEDSERIFVMLARLNDLEEFINISKKILNEQPLSSIEGRPNRQIKAGKRVEESEDRG